VEALEDLGGQGGQGEAGGGAPKVSSTGCGICNHLRIFILNGLTSFVVVWGLAIFTPC
jgi:hypothetical protein